MTDALMSWQFPDDGDLPGLSEDMNDVPTLDLDALMASDREEGRRDFGRGQTY